MRLAFEILLGIGWAILFVYFLLKSSDLSNDEEIELKQLQSLAISEAERVLENAK